MKLSDQHLAIQTLPEARFQFVCSTVEEVLRRWWDFMDRETPYSYISACVYISCSLKPTKDKQACLVLSCAVFTVMAALDPTQVPNT